MHNKVYLHPRGETSSQTAMAFRKSLTISTSLLLIVMSCHSFEWVQGDAAAKQDHFNTQKRLFKNTFKLTERGLYNRPPSIVCPADIETIQDRGSLSAVVYWKTPVGYDAEDGRITNVRRAGPPSGSRFSGERTIKYTVQDIQGRTASCTFSVKVNIIRCRPLPMDNILINSCFGKNIFYGDECHFSCPEGYTLKGKAALTCNKEGQFDGQRPDCEIKTCPAPHLPHGAARWECTSKYDYNSYCTIKCKDGFRNMRTSDRTPWDQATITCQANRTWTRIPECKDVSAPTITNCPVYTTAYANRGVRYTTVTWDDIRATDTNSGTVTVTQVKGQPSGSVFTEGAHEVSFEAVDNAGLTDTCTFYVNVEVLYCSVPVLKDSKVDLDCKNQFMYGSGCSMSCRQGVTLKGAQTMSCERRDDKMYWDFLGPEPTCDDPAGKVVRFTCWEGSDYCVCRWGRPTVLNGQLLGYDIVYRDRKSSNVQTVQIQNNATELYAIDRLKPEINYVITIYPVTQYGRGLGSTEMVFIDQAQ